MSEIFASLAVYIIQDALVLRDLPLESGPAERDDGFARIPVACIDHVDQALDVAGLKGYVLYIR